MQPLVGCSYELCNFIYTVVVLDHGVVGLTVLYYVLCITALHSDRTVVILRDFCNVTLCNSDQQ